MNSTHHLEYIKKSAADILNQIFGTSSGSYEDQLEAHVNQMTLDQVLKEVQVLISYLEKEEKPLDKSLWIRRNANVPLEELELAPIEWLEMVIRKLLVISAAIEQKKQQNEKDQEFKKVIEVQAKAILAERIRDFTACNNLFEVGVVAGRLRADSSITYLNVQEWIQENGKRMPSLKIKVTLKETLNFQGIPRQGVLTLIYMQPVESQDFNNAQISSFTFDIDGDIRLEANCLTGDLSRLSLQLSTEETSLVEGKENKGEANESGEKDLLIKITDTLSLIGIPAHIKGYSYLREAIIFAYNNPNATITKDIYPSLAAVFNTTANKVERAMRHAINLAWNNAKEQLTSLVNSSKLSSRPTNAAFIFSIVERLKVQHMA